MILSTVGPLTVIRYLDYALGKGIGPSSLADPERAVTLEYIGQEVDSASAYTTNTEATCDLSNGDGDENTGVNLRETVAEGNVPQESPSFLYGMVGNKIGEACAAFLTRWGIDLLDMEEQLVDSHPGISTACPPVASTSSSITWRSTTPSLRLWSQGLSAEWVRGILSSDELFVTNEMKRYEAAKQVIDMRRRTKGAVPMEEREWDLLFQEGIYFSHFVRLNPAIWKNADIG